MSDNDVQKLGSPRHRAREPDCCQCVVSKCHLRVSSVQLSEGSRATCTITMTTIAILFDL
jgi:hypothetical protein